MHFHDIFRRRHGSDTVFVDASRETVVCASSRLGLDENRS